LLTDGSLINAQDIDEWKEKLASWGYNPIMCSVDSQIGLAPIMELLEEKISVVVGPSGVGKSSLINALRDVAGVDLRRENEAMQRLETLASKEDGDVIIPQVCVLF
jgi:ribosome biogenesis GTPase